MRVEHLTWPQYRDVISTRLVVLPLGAIDGHGPHLPLSTDTIISNHLATALEKHVELLVLPALPYGRKTEARAGGGEFSGVTHLRASTLTNVVTELLRTTYGHGARRFLILDSHMANVCPVTDAVDRFIDAAPDARIMVAAWWDLVSEESRNAIAAETGVARADDHHAAMVETSLVMHVAPALVRDDLLCDATVERHARYLIRPLPEALATSSGVVYKATRADPAIGARLLDEIVTNLAAAVALDLGAYPGAGDHHTPGIARRHARIGEGRRQRSGRFDDGRPS